MTAKGQRFEAPKLVQVLVGLGGCKYAAGGGNRYECNGVSWVVSAGADAHLDRELRHELNLESVTDFVSPAVMDQTRV